MENSGMLRHELENIKTYSKDADFFSFAALDVFPLEVADYTERLNKRQTSVYGQQWVKFKNELETALAVAQESGNFDPLKRELGSSIQAGDFLIDYIEEQAPNIYFLDSKILLEKLILCATLISDKYVKMRVKWILSLLAYFSSLAKINAEEEFLFVANRRYASVPSESGFCENILRSFDVIDVAGQG